MIPVDSLIAVFRNILGWPYESPGSNNANGIDCSGAFVYAYRQFGKSIYHGSNRMIRVFCTNVKRVTRVSELRKGMAIFKANENTSGMSAIYKPGGQYYNAELPHDYYHVGLVASTSPLQIINATRPYARIDNDLSKWHSAGYLKAVDYSEISGSGSETPAPGEDQTTATVIANSGGTVNMRKQPSKNAIVLVRIPLGQKVKVLDKTDDTWWQITYEYTGYMMREFLQEEK